MELNIKDRIYIPQMLAPQNNFMEYNLKRSIIKKVAITEKDKETFDIKEDKENSRIVWNIEKDRENPLTVDFTEEEIKYLTKSCEQLSDNEFPDDFWAVVEKIYNAANK